MPPPRLLMHLHRRLVIACYDIIAPPIYGMFNLVLNDKFSVVVEFQVSFWSDFQSGSRGLKKVLKTYTYV